MAINFFMALPDLTRAVYPLPLLAERGATIHHNLSQLGQASSQGCRSSELQ
jgi:hypothetical protein